MDEIVSYWACPGMKFRKAPITTPDFLLDAIIEFSVEAQDPITKAVFYSSDRSGLRPFYRHAFCWLAMRYYKLFANPRLCSEYTRKDRTSVLHGVTTFQNYIDTTNSLALKLFKHLNITSNDFSTATKSKHQ